MRSDFVFVMLVFCFLGEAVSALRVAPQFNCPTLTLRNGKVKRRQRGRFVKFLCSTGYMLAGEKFSTCTYGKWDPVPPKCVRPTCTNKVNPPTNGLIYPTHSGAALHFYCKPGFQIKGPTDIYCDGRNWDNNMPSCLATDAKPKLFCDFEEEDICGWSHDLNHDFDWRREHYNTPSGSIGTGPSYDHTKGQGADGYYMYIESSSRNENDTARLISPIFDRSDNETCLEFFYHMYGATTGSLRVYVKRESDSWILHAEDAVFSKSGNQGDKWYRAYQSLGVVGEEYQIVIEGVRGPGYVSDIAIDDVKIIENCVYEEMPMTTELYSSTELLLTVESCENRCGHKANGNETLQITCDCDDNCYDSRRCCPDYFDFCISVTTTEDYFSTTDISNEIDVSTMKISHEPSSLPVKSTRERVFTTELIKTVATVKLTTTESSAATIKLPTTAPTKKLITKSTTKPKTTKKIIYVTRPTVRLLTQPTLPVFVKKILPTAKTPPKKNATSKIIYVKPKKIDRKDKENDIMYVPRQENSDDELLLTSPLPEVNVKENRQPQELEDDLDSSNLGNFSEKDKFLSVKASNSAGYNVVLVVISVVGIAVLTTVITVILVRRYRCSHRRMASSSGDSQSDVRFLTSDEVLDFSLNKDYDSL